ncbi:MAG: DUF58 domain-containing protein [Thiomargarita sp.]|nr:DUF58 domain-containing protein [Thiomargarita sp.]
MRRFLFHGFRVLYYIDQLWIRRRFSSIGFTILGGLMAAGSFGIDIRQTFAYQLFCILFTLLLIAILSSWFIRLRLQAWRKLPKFGTVGEKLDYQIQVQNFTHKIQANLSLQENIKLNSPSFEVFLQTKEPGDKKRNWFDQYVGYHRWTWLMYMGKKVEIAEQIVPSLAPVNQQHNYVTINMSLKPLHRGYVHFTGISFACPDPFGLFRSLYTVPLEDNLLILPKRYPVREIKLFGSRKYQRGGVNLAMSVGDSEEFFSLREYRPGDSLRHIHWKNLAKMGKPVIKEFQDEFFVRHALILDTFSQNITTEVFETAVSVASSFACAPRNSEILLDLMFVGVKTYQFTSGRGLVGVDNFLEILACVTACPDKTFAILPKLVMQQLSSLSGCICVLLNWDKNRQNFIQQLKSRKVPLLVVVISTQELEIDPAKFPEVQVLLVDKIAEMLGQL